MRTLLILFFFFNLTGIFGQVKYDQNVIKQYDSIYKKLPAKYKELANQLEKDKNYGGGLALTISFIEDTLNIADLQPDDTTIKIFDTNGISPAVDSEPKISDQPIMLVIGALNSDTLSIRITPWFMSNQTIHHAVIGKKIKTTYNEFYKYGSLLKTVKAKTATNDLTIPSKTIKFTLSDNMFAFGKTIYGYAEIITDEYIYLAAYNFKNKMLKHCFHFRYYFKFKLTKNLL